MREALDQVLAATDLFLPSGAGALLFSRPRPTRRPRSRRLLDRGVARVVVKKGAEGAGYHDAAGTLACRASPSRRSIRPAPATPSARPSSPAGCAACRRRGAAYRQRRRRARRPPQGADGGHLDRRRARRFPGRAEASHDAERASAGAPRAGAPPATGRHHLGLLGASAGHRGDPPPRQGARAPTC